jgi:hypothetical protein
VTRVLIISSADDVHARRVAQELDSYRAQVAMVDVRELGRACTLSYELESTGVQIVIDGGKSVSLSEVDAVWLRRPSIPYLPATVSDIGDRRFARNEWRELVDGVFLSMKARFVNSFLAQFGAVKPRQLDAARRVGLDVPETMITSDQDKAAAFLHKHKRVVHKAMSAHPERLLDTRRWTEQDRESLALLRLAPAIFQEEIAGPADIRTTVVGDRCFSASISSSPGRIDSRLDLDASCECHDLPDDVEERLHSLMRELGLVFGTVDLRIDYNGRYIFLEVNPQGQFLYVEIQTGLPISRAVARLLAAAR